MDAVDLVLRKFDGRPHRRVTGRLLGEDSWGVWLGTARGTAVHYSYGSRQIGHTRADAVRLIPRDSWWTAMFLAEPDSRDVYCDVTMPAVWTGPNEITVVDLDIDVVRYRADGRVEVEDEDEFEEHRRELGYPDEVVAAALSAAAYLRTALSSAPFVGDYLPWLAKV